uniref:Uncharacterized protein n=1 Tax=Rhizophora mucronata TaxID=61149 RepID=A0A2P2M1N8_RHIMU
MSTSPYCKFNNRKQIDSTIYNQFKSISTS